MAERKRNYWQLARRRISSDIETLRFVGGSYANVIIVIAVAIGTALGSHLMEPFNSILVWTGLAGAILAVPLKGGVVLMRMRSGSLGERSTERAQLGNPFQHELTAAWPSSQPVIEKSQLSNSAWSTYFWHDDEVNEELRKYRLPIGSRESQHAVMATLRANDYSLPPLLDLIAPRIMWRSGLKRDENGWWSRFKNRPVKFNGKLVRLATEPTASQLRQGSLQLQKVRYFDGECSNEAWRFMLNTKNAGIEPSQDFMTGFVFNNHQRIKALHESEAANIIGVTILAVTSDGYAVLIQQPKNQAVAAEHYSATGSGSVNHENLSGYIAARTDTRRIRLFRLRSKLRLISVDDLDDTDIDFLELVWESMYARMSAESAIDNIAPGIQESRAATVDEYSFRCTGYFRWMSRAAKPEFSGLVKLKLTKQEVLRRFQQTATVDSDGDEPRFIAVNDLVQVFKAEGASRMLAQLRTQMSPSSEHTVVRAVEYMSCHPEWLAQS